MWNKCTLTMDFTTRLCGGSPRDAKLLERHVERRTATDAEFKKLQAEVTANDRPPLRTVSEVVDERVDTIDVVPDGTTEEMEQRWVGFSKDELGLFVPGGNVRAHLKDCAGVLTKAMKLGHIDGLVAMANFAHHLKNAVYVREDRVHIRDKEGKRVMEASGYRDMTLSPMTAQGPRTCLKRVDYVEDARIVCTVLMMEYSQVKIAHLRKCLEYGEQHGFGQDRSLQFGRYKATLVPAE